jgi:hypothetical protein
MRAASGGGLAAEGAGQGAGVLQRLGGAFLDDLQHVHVGTIQEHLQV